MSQHLANNNNAHERRKSNIGIRLTVLYAVIYGGFVVLSVFYPTIMGTETLFGLNLAVAYGLGLIIIAIILAMIYNQLVRSPKSPNPPKSARKAEHTQEEI